MATGGRVLHHLKAMAPDERNTTSSSRASRSAAAAARGWWPATREVKIHGEYVPVRAEVQHLQGFSGHADRDELLAWLRHLQRSRRSQTFVVHGEPDAADALRVAIQNELGWAVRVPEFGESVAL